MPVGSGDDEMTLDLSSILNFEGKTMALEKELDFAKDNDAGLCFEGPVKVSGTVSNVGGSLELSAKATATIVHQCDRCCEEFPCEFSCNFEERMLKEDFHTESNENPGAIYFKATNVDLGEIVLNNIILSLPLKNLCKDDCQGLCPVCGKNLNNGGCDCDSRTTDPRFDILDKLL